MQLVAHPRSESLRPRWLLRVLPRPASLLVPSYVSEAGNAGIRSAIFIFIYQYLSDISLHTLELCKIKKYVETDLLP